MADYKLPIITGTSLAVGDLLRWDGNDWVNYADSAYVAVGANIVMPDGGTIRCAGAPLLTFDDTNNFLEITGCNVGIGTASPQGKLHVHDAALETGSDLILSRFWGGVNAVRGSAIFHYYDATVYDLLVFGVAGDEGPFYTNPNTLAAAKMVIQPGGNVGIGDVAPASKLDVTGDINTTVNYKVDDVQVISNRVIDVRCDDAINSGDATTDGVIDSLRDAMITHGLVAAA